MKSPGPPQKVALVTGASHGLGRVVAGFVAKQGYALITMARGEADLAAAAKDFAAAGVPVISLAGDVSQARDRHRLLEAAKQSGRIDLLVNNASDLGDSPLPFLEKASRESDRKSTRLNSSHSQISYAVFCLKKKSSQLELYFVDSHSRPPLRRVLN